MGTKLLVHDVTCDGAHFSATSLHGPIEGSGSFKQGDTDKSGTIVGRVSTGPDTFVNHQIFIKVDGNDGLCYIP